MAANWNSQPVHVAITRRVKPGREQEFETALKEFFALALAQSGVHGAALIVPAPGSGSTEYGIIRSFASAAERDAFYASALYAEWKKRVAPFSDGQPETRELHGLEASDLSKSRFWVREQSQFEVPFFGPGAAVADGPSRRAFSGPCR